MDKRRITHIPEIVGGGVQNLVYGKEDAIIKEM